MKVIRIQGTTQANGNIATGLDNDSKKALFAVSMTCNTRATLLLDGSADWWWTSVEKFDGREWVSADSETVDILVFYIDNRYLPL